MAALPRLSRVLVAARDLRLARAFFGEGGLGLRLEGEAAQPPPPPGASAASAASAANSVPAALFFAGGLTVRAGASEAALSAGSTPTLCFDVEDVAALVPRLLALGASLDGAIEFAPRATVATLRAPSGAGGAMLSLVENLS
jgi:hypothetical protein